MYYLNWKMLRLETHHDSRDLKTNKEKQLGDDTGKIFPKIYAIITHIY